MQTFSEVIAALGGSAVVARAIEVPDGTVRQWRQRDSIPADRWPKLVAFAKEREVEGVTLETLVDLAARTPSDLPLHPDLIRDSIKETKRGGRSV